MNSLLPSTLHAIGNTPLVELSRITQNVDGKILAKLDYLNPGFSKKDRIAKQIIEDAEAEGKLKAGRLIREIVSHLLRTPFLHRIENLFQCLPAFGQ